SWCSSSVAPYRAVRIRASRGRPLPRVRSAPSTPKMNACTTLSASGTLGRRRPPGISLRLDAQKMTSIHATAATQAQGRARNGAPSRSVMGDEFQQHPARPARVEEHHAAAGATGARGGVDELRPGGEQPLDILL